MRTALSPLSAALVLGLAIPAWAVNDYETPMLGTWEVEDEAALVVLDDDNACYRADEDGIKTSRRGRWSADSQRLTMELKYNGPLGAQFVDGVYRWRAAPRAGAESHPPQKRPASSTSSSTSSIS